MAEAKIVRVSDKTTNKHGVECRIAFTEDYVKPNSNGVDVFYEGQIRYTENKALFKHFKVGNLVNL